MDIGTTLIIVAAILAAAATPITVLILEYKDKQKLLDRLMAKDFPEYRQFSEDLAPIIREQRKAAKDAETKKERKRAEDPLYEAAQGY